MTEQQACKPRDNCAFHVVFRDQIHYVSTKYKICQLMLFHECVYFYFYDTSC